MVTSKMGVYDYIYLKNTRKKGKFIQSVRRKKAWNFSPVVRQETNIQICNMFSGYKSGKFTVDKFS